MGAWDDPKVTNPLDPDRAALMRRTYEAFNARDAKRTAGVFDEKGTFVSARGESISGRAAIEKDLAADFAGALKEAHIGVTAEHLSQVTPDVFVQTDFFYVAGRKDAAGKDTPIALSHYLVVWVKRADGWKIAALQAMVPAK